MINLLPAELKEQMRYAKLNRLVLRYVRVTIAVVVVLGGIFAGAAYLLEQQTTSVASDVEQKKQTIMGLSKSFLPKAKDASERLNATKYVQQTQTKFAELIADLTSVIPSGVSIDSMTLTGDDKKPVQMVVSTVTYEEVLALRDALMTSPRVSGVDITSITFTRTAPRYLYKGTLSIGFKLGQAK